jgi:hypothetical protein
MQRRILRRNTVESPDCTCEHGHELCAYEWGGWCSRDIEAQNEAAQLQYSMDEYVDLNGLDYSDLEVRS